MKVGLVGFAGSGKTTVFNALTGLNVPVGFGGEVRLGTVKVPDPRIDALSKIFQPKKTTYAEISFADIPGEHAAEKKGLSSKALQQIRDQEVLCLVLRDFANPALEGTPDAPGDLEAFHAECVLADLDIIERKLDRLHKEKASPLEVATFDKMKAALEAERPLRALSAAELRAVREGRLVRRDDALGESFAVQPAHGDVDDDADREPGRPGVAGAGMRRERDETSLVPGRFFDLPDCFRLGIGGETGQLREGLERLSAAVEEFSKRGA